MRGIKALLFKAKCIETITILLFSARVLAAQGYTRTNTNLVAETAGISVSLLYQYFANKDGLIAALHDERHSRANADEVKLCFQPSWSAFKS
ncbi:MAG: helix-turn-helix domain containing protein [Rhizonema sp. PD38]|nr:helix-turn-helix domain containing protein [Rhizonema sp. PD38]